MASALIQVRVDDSLKNNATKVFSNLGIDISTAVRMFLTRAIQVEGIPFPTSNENYYDSISTLDNIKAIRNESIKNGTANLTLDDINAEIDAYRSGK